jgi:hypothetical protein
MPQVPLQLSSVLFSGKSAPKTAGKDNSVRALRTAKITAEIANVTSSQKQAWSVTATEGFACA